MKIYDEELSTEGEYMKKSWIMTRILRVLPPKLYHFRIAYKNISGTDKGLTTIMRRLRLKDTKLTETK